MIETASDIFSSIPPRRVWLGRVAGIMALALLLAAILLSVFRIDLLIPLWGVGAVLFILLSPFVKSKPMFRTFDGVLLGIGIAGLFLFSLLLFAYSVEIAYDLIRFHFTQVFSFLSFLPFVLYDVVDFLHNIYMLIIFCLILLAPVWLGSIALCAKAVFRFYRSRFFYWVLLLLPVFLMLIGAWRATVSPSVTQGSAACFHDGKC